MPGRLKDGDNFAKMQAAELERKSHEKLGNRCPVCKKLTEWNPQGSGCMGCYSCAECGVAFYGVPPTNLVEVGGVLSKA